MNNFGYDPIKDLIIISLFMAITICTIVYTDVKKNKKD